MEPKNQFDDDSSVETSFTDDTTISMKRLIIDTHHTKPPQKKKRRVLSIFRVATKYQQLSTNHDKNKDESNNPARRKRETNDSEELHFRDSYDMTNIFTIDLDSSSTLAATSLHSKFEEQQGDIPIIRSNAQKDFTQSAIETRKSSQYDTFFLGTKLISNPSKSARRRIKPSVKSYNFLSKIASEAFNDEKVEDNLFPEQPFTELVTADEFLSNAEFSESPFKLLPADGSQEIVECSVSEESDPSLENNDQEKKDAFDEYFDTTNGETKVQFIEETDLRFSFRSVQGKYSGQVVMTPTEPIAHGRGRVMFLNGDIYEGSFKLGEMHGKGATFLSKKNGTRYYGDYKLNQKHGTGRQHYSNGKVFTGQFENDLPHGYGIEVDASYETVRFGLWEKGVPILHCNRKRK